MPGLDCHGGLGFYLRNSGKPVNNFTWESDKIHFLL